MSNGTPGQGGSGGDSTTQDIIELINSEAVKNLTARLTKALDQKKDSNKREALKDEIFGQAMSLLDLLIDIWNDIKAEKAVEGGYEQDVDEIDELIAQIRDKLREAYTAAGQATDEAGFNAVKAKIEELQRLLNELKRKIKRLERKQRAARRGGQAPGGTTPGGGGQTPGGTTPGGGTAPGGTKASGGTGTVKPAEGGTGATGGTKQQPAR